MEINTIAPDFKLFNSDKKEIILSDNEGKHVLLLFFPLAFTSTHVLPSYAVLEIITIFITT